jgi:phospholipid transport system substrate-binding protein
MVRGVAVAFAFALVTCSGAWAATPGAWAATPTDALREVFRHADRILTNPDTEHGPLERLLAVRKLVNEAFDFRSAAELASGDHWRARTLAEQEEFTWLFGDLLERAFVSRMAAKASLARGTKIRYLTESIRGTTAFVQTAMAQRDGGEMLLDYQMIRRDGAWKIRDVTIDGVSVMANYRAQLDRVLGNASFPELLTHMRSKVASIDLPPRSVARAETSPAANGTPSSPAPSATHGAAMRVTAPATPETPARPEIVVRPPAAVHTKPPAEPDATALSVPPRAPRTRAYWLQVTTVDTTEEAGRLATRLREGNLPVSVALTGPSGTPRLQVRVGPFQDAADAVSTLLRLQANGHDPFLFAERE